MAVFKRFGGQRIKAGHPAWDRAIWCVEFRIGGQRINKPLPKARTQSDAKRMEEELRATGEICGTVRDASGAAVAGATIVLTSSDRTDKSIITLISDTRGEYCAPLVRVGNWTLKATHAGFQDASGEVALTARQRKEVCLELASSNDSFSDFVDHHYLPDARRRKRSADDDERRARLLKEAFGHRPLGEITRMEIKRLKSDLLAEKTCRGTLRSGATVNRYISLLSSIFKLALDDHHLIKVNHCAKLKKEREGKRERYLTYEEEAKLLGAMKRGVCSFVRAPLIVAINSGLRRSELFNLKVGHINLGEGPVFRRAAGSEVEVPPDHLLVTHSKNGRHRLIPMNEQLRSTLAWLCTDSEPDEFVFSLARNGLSKATLRDGFAQVCEAAHITHGATKEGGLIWHDLRHTFATRLRESDVHQFDIMQLMGHRSVAMSERYAHPSSQNLSRAVKDMGARAVVIEFPRVRRAV
jgi:integrase